MLLRRRARSICNVGIVVVFEICDVVRLLLGLRMEVCLRGVEFLIWRRGGCAAGRIGNWVGSHHLWCSAVERVVVFVRGHGFLLL